MTLLPNLLPFIPLLFTAPLPILTHPQGKPWPQTRLIPVILVTGSTKDISAAQEQGLVQLCEEG